MPPILLKDFLVSRYDYSFMSANTIKKAKALAKDGGVVKIDDDLYQVKSTSAPSKSYFVTSDTCECEGFKNFYKFHHGGGLKANCSHLEAVRIFKKMNENQEAGKSRKKLHHSYF